MKTWAHITVKKPSKGLCLNHNFAAERTTSQCYTLQKVLTIKVHAHGSTGYHPQLACNLSSAAFYVQTVTAHFTSGTGIL